MHKFEWQAEFLVRLPHSTNFSPGIPHLQKIQSPIVEERGTELYYNFYSFQDHF